VLVLIVCIISIVRSRWLLALLNLRLSLRFLFNFLLTADGRGLLWSLNILGKLLLLNRGLNLLLDNRGSLYILGENLLLRCVKLDSLGFLFNSRSVFEFGQAFIISVVDNWEFNIDMLVFSDHFFLKNRSHLLNHVSTVFHHFRQKFRHLHNNLVRLNISLLHHLDLLVVHLIQGVSLVVARHVKLSVFLEVSNLNDLVNGVGNRYVDPLNHRLLNSDNLSFNFVLDFNILNDDFTLMDIFDPLRFFNNAVDVERPSHNFWR